MTHALVDVATIEPGRGPHPAASPYDRRVSDVLGLTAFETYQVELPPGAGTVEHDHVEDGHEDLYAVLTGSGRLVVDGDRVAVRPGHFVAVSTGSRRLMEAGPDGLAFIAVCAAPPGPSTSAAPPGA